MKRFARSVVGQFTVSTAACALLFALTWTIAGWVVGELVDGSSPLQK